MDKFPAWDHDKYQYLQYKNIRENLEYFAHPTSNLVLRYLQVLKSYRNFSDKHDYANAFLKIEINSDSDSEIWSNNLLLQMYINWAESHKVKHEILEFNIINYIYHPQDNIVKSLIYDIENNFQDTVDGNVDGFIEAHLNLAL